jgi:anhydro-N-acetylmuramic acid kinase
LAEELYIGLMSGTSMDGVDAALVGFSGEQQMRLLQTCAYPWPPLLADALRQLAGSATTSLLQFGQLDAQVGDTFAAAVKALLQSAGVTPAEVRAIGSHGQTVFHAPDAHPPFSLQIGDPNRIAQATGITTVADFRRRDMAAGGQGAPLVPAFHADRFAASGETRAVLNLGGIANLTLLPGAAGRAVTGFDTGPGNCLLDLWTRRHRRQPFDAGGAWAAGGKSHPPLLERLLADPYFLRPPPKSTGPEYFSGEWLASRLADLGTLPAVDVQATLLALTVRSVADALQRTAPDTQRLLVCGGGAHNATLMAALAQQLAPISVESTAVQGLDPDWVEAAAFAWLARATLAGRPGNLPAVTGARAAVVLGGIYPA